MAHQAIRPDGHLAGEVSSEEQALATALIELQRVADRLSRACREGLAALQARTSDPTASAWSGVRR